MEEGGNIFWKYYFFVLSILMFECTLVAQFRNFQNHVDQVKREFLLFMILQNKQYQRRISKVFNSNS